MNPSATTLIRACRPPSSCSFVQRCPSSIKSFRASNLRPRYTSVPRCAAFSSVRRLNQAQAVNDIPSSASEGIVNASTADESLNPTQTVLVRSETKSKEVFFSPVEVPLDADFDPEEAGRRKSEEAKAAADAAFLASSLHLTGRVSRVGTMRKTVRVSRTVQVWDKYLRKNYKREACDLVHDPKDILNEGDVITYGPFPPSLLEVREQRGQVGGKSRVKYVLRDVLTPFGTPVEQRTSRVVGSPEGRWAGGPGQVQKVVLRARGKAKPKVQVPLLKKDGAMRGGEAGLGVVRKARRETA
ncbi:hypothetical protein LTS15_009773 [Exophiala xenobiotica]|nr:hypothetical protein LTS15_009773 [Exophiala xenobiotica]